MLGNFGDGGAARNRRLPSRSKFLDAFSTWTYGAPLESLQCAVPGWPAGSGTFNRAPAGPVLGAGPGPAGPPGAEAALAGAALAGPEETVGLRKRHRHVGRRGARETRGAGWSFPFTCEGNCELNSSSYHFPLLLAETSESQALVPLQSQQPPQSTVEQSQPVQQGEKPIITLESAVNQKRVELKSAPKPESEGKLEKQADEVKPRPRPGDLIEIFRIGYEHWAIYVEDDCVVHLAPPTEGIGARSITSIFSNRAVVKYSRLEDVLHGCSWKISNKLDGTYLPLPVEKIMQRTRNMVNKIVQYSLMEGNCEHFVNDLRYGVPRSQQVEHILMEGAKAAGVVISAVVDGIKPKPEGALLAS
ncbi:phospholipase A and acyltransferase 5 [Dipodomys spectabilis]|uniref:phospholipase A and acyltransferase 5 n=1 Tax=Dipodomys spectabilis TaxID=105255 RepID=UPI001C542689|nr:phospholipase A and acyltransferase 5 [Dipodomys spectabilis]